MAAMSPRVNAEDTLKIGVVGPLSGPAAASGIALSRGMTIAADEVNAKGGVKIDGVMRKIQVLTEDSESKPAVGVSATEKLITRDHVALIIGDTTHSSVALAMMDLAPQYNVPILTGLPTANEITTRTVADPETYKLVWKGNYGTSAYTQAISGFVGYLLDQKKMEPKNKTIAFICEDTDYGRTLIDMTQEAFKAKGWTTVAAETVQLGQSDFYPQLTKIKRLNPDVLVTGFTNVPMGVALTKQYAEIGFSSLHFGTYYEELPGFLDQVGSAAEGEVWVPTYNPVPEALAAEVKKRFNVTTVAFDYASGHDLMNVALQALDKAGTLKPDDLARGFAAVDYVGIKGRYVFDPKTHVVKDGPDFVPMVTGQIQDNKRVSIWPENRGLGRFKALPSAK